MRRAFTVQRGVLCRSFRSAFVVDSAICIGGAVCLYFVYLCFSLFVFLCLFFFVSIQFFVFIIGVELFLPYIFDRTCSVHLRYKNKMRCIGWRMGDY